jgi:hypothetical protein
MLKTHQRRYGWAEYVKIEDTNTKTTSEGARFAHGKRESEVHSDRTLPNTTLSTGNREYF